MDSSDLRRRTLEAVRSCPSPTRREARLRASAVMALSAAAAIAVFVRAGAVRAAPRPMTLILGTSLGAALLAAIALWAAWGRGGSMLGRARPSLRAVIVAVPLALLAWKLAWSSRFPHMMAVWPERIGLRCLGLTLTMALGPLVGLALLRRDSEPLHPGTVGAALGVGVGAAAWVLLDLWCPVAYLPHMLLGHLLPMVLLAGLGAALGRRLLSLRTA